MVTIIVLVIVIGLFLAWFFSHKSKTEERRLLIEKGFSPSELPETKSFKFPWLKIGIFITTCGLGFIVIDMVHTFKYSGVDEGLIMGILILFAGLGLLASHFIPKKLKGNQEDEN